MLTRAFVALLSFAISFAPSESQCAVISVLRLKGHSGGNLYLDVVQNSPLFGADTITFSSFNGQVTLSALISFAPDVLIISNPSGGNVAYTVEEKNAILAYLSQEGGGKGLLGEGYVFNSIGDTRPKLHFLGELFGFQEGIIYDNIYQGPGGSPFGSLSFNISPLYANSLLFEGFAQSYTSTGFLAGNIPSGDGWTSASLGSATTVAGSVSMNSIITVYDARNFRSIYSSVWAGYQGGFEDQRFIYNSYRSIFYKDALPASGVLNYFFYCFGLILTITMRKLDK